MFNLTEFTTLKLPFSAASILKLSSVENVCVSIPDLGDRPRLILGGGSNLVVLDSEFEGIVLRPEIKVWNPSIIGSDVLLEVGAGHTWHEVVTETLNQGWYGIENLALIPGWMGAAPIQNIGAYGVELKDHCHRVTLYDFEEHAVVQLDNSELRFGYRHSILKEHPNRFLVLTVTLALSTKANTRCSYGSIEEEIARQELNANDPRDIAKVVISIRQAKLPDPEVVPNVGSFFKNPIVRVEVATRLSAAFPCMPSYGEGDQVKLAAGWMIDQIGFKGKRVGGFAVDDKQALVLTNDRTGTVEDLRKLVYLTRKEIKRVFGISLSVEPTQLGQLNLS